MKREHEADQWVTCACGKKAYPSRRAAKRRAKQVHPEDRKFNYYRCTYSLRWHYGHLGPAGRDFYRRTA